MTRTDEFADLKFKAECGEVALIQAGAAGHVIRGPGELWQDENGDLQFKIFTDEAGFQAAKAHASRPGVVGQLIRDEELFNLTAREHNSTGWKWTASQILPSHRGFRDGVVFGSFQELTQKERFPVNSQYDGVLLKFKGRVEFPYNQGTQKEVRLGGELRGVSHSANAAVVEDGDYRFEIVHEGEHTNVSLRLPAGQLNKVTPYRIRESLQFVLGRQLALMTVETHSGGEHTSHLRSPFDANGQMSPPLGFFYPEQRDHVWHMFVKYFQHVHLDRNSRWHPISRHISGTLASMAVSVNVGILALAVAIEGLIADCFPDIAPADPTFISEIDTALAALNPLKLSGQTLNRIKGSLNAMKRPRNTDGIKAFLASNRMPAALYDSWSYLRNVSAHGGAIDGREKERVLRLRDETIYFFYSIIFAAINYRGPRTNYGAPGQPDEPWPMPEA